MVSWAACGVVSRGSSSNSRPVVTPGPLHPLPCRGREAFAEYADLGPRVDLQNQNLG